MGIVILLVLAYLYWIGYWQYWAWVAKRDQRWNRWHYCRQQRNALLLFAGAIVAVAVAIYFS